MSGVPTMGHLAREAALLRERIPLGDPALRQRIGLYGTGFLGRWAVDHLRSLGMEPVVCFDSDPQKQGGTFRGIPVSAFPDASREPPDAVLITARHAVQAIAPMLERQGIAACPFDGWYVAHRFAAFEAVHDALLADDYSRRSLRAVLHAMLTGRREALHAVVERDPYFCLPQFTNPGREHYVDAGAFVGDSVERFIWANGGAFKKIWAFEPFERPFQALRVRTRRLIAEWALEEGAIVPVQAALGAASGAGAAETGSGQMQSAALTPSGDGDVRVIALDDHLEGAPVTLLKADVEGMEMALLEGAANTLKRCRPRLAICVYHYPCDIPDIAARIRSYVPEYQFALRHHSSQQMETVLYGWVE